MSNEVVTIAVAGGTASGKTTISTAILQQVGEQNMVHLLHDSYYKSWYELVDEREKGERDINFDHPSSLDTAMMIEHIKALQRWQPVEVPIYDFVKDERLPETIHVKPRPVILIEGILVLAEPELRALCDMKIYVDTDADLRFIRRLQRDLSERGRTVESVIEQYYATVRPMHNIFVEPSKRYADIVVPRGGRNAVAIAMIADRVRWILHLNNIDARPRPDAK